MHKNATKCNETLCKNPSSSNSVCIDLDDILHDFSATQVKFSMEYLGLPLSVLRLKTIHNFQPLEDKVANQLVPWIGKHATIAGHATRMEHQKL
jgi:hypothetical protein